MKEMVALNKKEQTRLVVLNQVERGEMTGKEIAGILDLSPRHERRILAALYHVPYTMIGMASLRGLGKRRKQLKRAWQEEANTVWPHNGRAGYYSYFFTLTPGKGKD